MARHTPDPKLVTRVLELVRAGCSAAEVEETLGVPKSTVTRWARAAEAACAMGRAKSAEIAAAVETLGEDWWIVDAAELVGIPPDAVRAWLRARVDRVLRTRGLPQETVSSWLEFSESRA